uniref:Cytochrome c oxidase subunit 2 n=1 Tax=Laqueus rubellus TaxID=93892 RepID=Q9MQZ1_LAQRU|nr:cytochrome c oxidase subunit II [Laqueus rubellus]BAA95926.1 cytochrome oxidase subunit 2 [Laqueus rubellus]
MAYWLQDGISPVMEQTIFFHDYVMMGVVAILVIVMYISLPCLSGCFSSRNILESHRLEFAWTLLPAVVLVFLALPSLNLLYMSDNILDPSLTLKVVGHQWFWSYEYSDAPGGGLMFDSYMVAPGDLASGDFRLLEVDNRLVLPCGSHVRALVTSADVIHSWSIPSLGVKLDAIPGRLNSLSLFSNVVGVYYGQCSEICGANHSFMPICMEFITPDLFLGWVLG